MTTYQANLIALAGSCSQVRAAIGRMLLHEQDPAKSAAAGDLYRRSLRELLRHARDEECGLFLQVASEVGASTSPVA